MQKKSLVVLTANHRYLFFLVTVFFYAFTVSKLNAQPDTLQLKTTISYPIRKNPSDYTARDYRIVGLPGASNISVNFLLPGFQGRDWEVYWDSGASTDDPERYLRIFDSSPDFVFRVGSAFWIINKGLLSISTVVPSAPLNSSRAAEIPLHIGWNLITNPFNKIILWKKIQIYNSVSEPIWAFNGTFSISEDFAPFVGYYYFNNESLPTLKIPFDSTEINTRLSKSPNQFLWLISIALILDGIHYDNIELGVSEYAKLGLDNFDHHKPRAISNAGQIVFKRSNWDSKYSLFATDIRPPFTNLESWEFKIKNIRDKQVSLLFSGISEIPNDFSVYLFDDSRFKKLNLRESAMYFYYSVDDFSQFRILVGNTEKIEIEANKLLKPEQFSLHQNFPNPFNPETIIPIQISKQSFIQLKIFNLTGQNILTLFEGEIEPGEYFFKWDGKDDLGIKLPSGVYFVSLIVSEKQILTRKLVLMK